MGNYLDEQEALEFARQQLANWLMLPSDKVRADRTPDDPDRPDGFIRTPDKAFLVEVKAEGSQARVKMAIEHLLAFPTMTTREPLIVVPYMGEGGRKACAEAGVSWLDLSGNADVRSQGLRVLIEGKENRYKATGRPASIFSPKSSRIARVLLRLGSTGTHLGQGAIAKLANVDEGMTSRIIKRMIELGLVRKNSAGMIVVPDRGRLLDAWHDEADLSKNTILKGHLAARNPAAATRTIVEAFQPQAQLTFAFTGLSAAWQYDQFAMHRLISVYVSSKPNAAALAQIGFKEEPRGANTWLIIPKDEGVFYGTQVIDDVPCVMPEQVYIDLKGHPERAHEAADHLRQNRLQY
jgi:hypothetical protein